MMPEKQPTAPSRRKFVKYSMSLSVQSYEWLFEIGAIAHVTICFAEFICIQPKHPAEGLAGWQTSPGSSLGHIAWPARQELQAVDRPDGGADGRLPEVESARDAKSAKSSEVHCPVPRAGV